MFIVPGTDSNLFPPTVNNLVKKDTVTQSGYGNKIFDRIILKYKKNTRKSKRRYDEYGEEHVSLIV